MADIIRLYAGPGPLPITVPFATEVTGAAALYFTGSAYSNVSEAILSFTVLVDDVSYGEASVYTNEAKSHKTLVGRVSPIRLTRGRHKLTIEDGPNTVTDGNDYFVVDVML